MSTSVNSSRIWSLWQTSRVMFNYFLQLEEGVLESARRSLALSKAMPHALQREAITVYALSGYNWRAGAS